MHFRAVLSRATPHEKIIVHTFRSTIVCDGDSVLEQPTTGESPIGFSMCAAAALDEHDMLIFGGSTKEQGMTADAYVLDTRTWAWRVRDWILTRTPSPPERLNPFFWIWLSSAEGCQSPILAEAAPERRESADAAR